MTARRAGVASAEHAWSADAGIAEEEIGLVARVVRLDMLVTRVLDRVVEPHGISVQDYLVLASVRRGLGSPVALCKVLGRTTGGMSLAIDRLVGSGWVDRRPDPVDRRRIVVELTAQGRSTAEAVNAALHEWEAGLRLSAQEMARQEAHLDDVIRLVTEQR